MTLSTTTNEISYTGLMGQDTFAYTFRVDQKTDMNVFLDTVPVAQGDFTITGLGNPAGGNIVLTTPLVADAIVLLQRIVPATQLVDYQPFDAFPAETHEGALDKLTMLVQQNGADAGRSLRFPAGDLANSILPPLVDRANRFLAFDASGEPVAQTSATIIRDDLTGNGVTAEALSANQGYQLDQDKLARDGSQPMTGGITINAVSPRILLIDTGAIADEGRWEFVAQGGNYRMSAVDDADVVINNFLFVTRTGAAVDSINLEATSINFTGIVTGDTAPSAGNHLTRKDYVDALIGGLSAETVIVGPDVSIIEVTGLTITADTVIDVDFRGIASAGGVFAAYLVINGDVVNTNYNSSIWSEVAAVINEFVANTPSLALGIGPSQEGMIQIKIFPNSVSNTTIVQFQSSLLNGTNPSNTTGTITYEITDVITSIGLRDSNGVSGLAAGSKLSVRYR